MILQEEQPKKITETRSLIQEIIWKEACYLELVAQDEKKHTPYRLVNTALHRLAQETASPEIVTSNFHYIQKDDKKAFEVALAIKDGKRIYDEGKRTFEGNGYILSEEEVRAMLKHNGYEADEIVHLIETTQYLADQCTVELPLGKILFPTYQPPEAIVALYEQHKNTLIVS